MKKKIYVLTSCGLIYYGFIGDNFKPEIFATKAQAKKRMKELYKESIEKLQADFKLFKECTAYCSKDHNFKSFEIFEMEVDL